MRIPPLALLPLALAALAAAGGEARAAQRVTFRDFRTLVVEEVAFDLAQYGLSLCITDTKGSHADLTDDYAAIRAAARAWPLCAAGRARSGNPGTASSPK